MTTILASSTYTVSPKHTVPWAGHHIIALYTYIFHETSFLSFPLNQIPAHLLYLIHMLFSELLPGFSSLPLMPPTHLCLHNL